MVEDKKLTLAYLTDLIEKVINKELSREEASDIAINLDDKVSEKKIIAFPVEKERFIWDSLHFIQGIDLLESPDVYLHNLQDLQDYLELCKDNLH